MSNKKGNAVNNRQKAFYESKKKNLPTRIWSFFRNGILTKTRKELGVEQEIYLLHKSWFGNLKEKKVLDLGCYAGNSLSLYLASNAKEYLAIDLSESGISILQKKLADIPTARAMAVDFLSGEFEEKNFDLIYAYGVLHHFKDVDELNTRLLEKLNPNGTIISYDPLQTSVPIKVLRTLYRPFQTDKEWEWPFSKRTYYKFSNAFKIKEKRAVFGKTKWSILINILPIPERFKQKLAAKWHREDWEQSAVDDKYMFTCMHLSMLMQKRD